MAAHATPLSVDLSSVMQHRYRSGMRHYSRIDRFLITADRAVRAVSGTTGITARPSPAQRIPAAELSAEQRRLAGRLLRVDHAGEVAAQALYEGQAAWARDKEVHTRLRQSASDEHDHLAWCAERVHDLGTHTSWLNPVWYAGSLAMGAMAGMIGDRWSLGFLSETERQVVRHIEDHLRRLPAEDAKSRAVLAQMRIDETHHGHQATLAGGEELPESIKHMMRLASRVMTGVAYWI